jgi:hypothetical protein
MTGDCSGLSRFDANGGGSIATNQAKESQIDEPTTWAAEEKRWKKIPVAAPEGRGNYDCVREGSLRRGLGESLRIVLKNRRHIEARGIASPASW